MNAATATATVMIIARSPINAPLYLELEDFDEPSIPPFDCV
jgi:hypothetical protein